MPDQHESGGVRVVIADDNRDGADLLALFLEASGYLVVATVYDGAAAVRETLSKSADLAILDINMPQKSGYEAASEIRAASPSTFLIAVSGLPQRPFSATFDHYLLKPFDLDRLLGVIEELTKSPDAMSEGDGVHGRSCREEGVESEDTCEYLSKRVVLANRSH